MQHGSVAHWINNTEASRVCVDRFGSEAMHVLHPLERKTKFKRKKYLVYLYNLCLPVCVRFEADRVIIAAAVAILQWSILTSPTFC